MKKSDKLLTKLGKSLDPDRRPSPQRGRGSTATAANEPIDVAAAVPEAVLTADLAALPEKAAATPAAEAADTGHAPESGGHVPFTTAEPSEAAKPVDLHAAAETIIKRHLPYALGAGLIPLPVVDVAAISGVQIKLIAELSTLYGVPFAANQAKAVIAALLGGAGSLSLATGLLGSLAKVIPGAGYVLGVGAVPLTAGALTYAVGHVFRAHFESGGTLLDFDPAAAKRVFMEKVEEGRAILKSL